MKKLTAYGVTEAMIAKLKGTDVENGDLDLSDALKWHALTARDLKVGRAPGPF